MSLYVHIDDAASQDVNHDKTTQNAIHKNRRAICREPKASE